jgi:hypothetical protein
VDDVDPRVVEERDQVGRAPFGRPCDVVVALVDSGRQLDPVALRLPPLDAAKKVGAVLPRARGRRDANRSAVGKSAREEGGRVQRRNLISREGLTSPHRDFKTQDPARMQGNGSSFVQFG